MEKSEGKRLQDGLHPDAPNPKQGKKEAEDAADKGKKEAEDAADKNKKEEVSVEDKMELEDVADKNKKEEVSVEDKMELEDVADKIHRIILADERKFFYPICEEDENDNTLARFKKDSSQPKKELGSITPGRSHEREKVATKFAAPKQIPFLPMKKAGNKSFNEPWPPCLSIGKAPLKLGTPGLSAFLPIEKAGNVDASGTGKSSPAKGKLFKFNKAGEGSSTKEKIIPLHELQPSLKKSEVASSSGQSVSPKKVQKKMTFKVPKD